MKEIERKTSLGKYSRRDKENLQIAEKVEQLPMQHPDKAIAVSEMTSLVSCSVSRHPMARRLLCPPKRFSEIGLGNLPKSFVRQAVPIPASSTEIKRLTGFPVSFLSPRARYCPQISSILLKLRKNALHIPHKKCYNHCEKIKKEASPMDSCDRRNVHMTMDTDYTAVSSVRKHPLLK